METITVSLKSAEGTCLGAVDSVGRVFLIIRIKNSDSSSCFVCGGLLAGSTQMAVRSSDALQSLFLDTRGLVSWGTFCDRNLEVLWVVKERESPLGTAVEQSSLSVFASNSCCTLIEI